VWLGAGCIVLKGVRIGEGAVIGAGSVVTKSVPAGEVWAGVPARPVRNSSTH
jgi:acetyltransferase-like isoleucine patch superfamily enzyme